MDPAPRPTLGERLDGALDRVAPRRRGAHRAATAPAPDLPAAGPEPDTGLSATIRDLARFCARHHLAVLAVWVLVAAGLLVGGTVAGRVTTDDIAVPGTDSAVAADLLGTSGSTATTPDPAGDPLLVRAPDGMVVDGATTARVTAAVERVEGVGEVTDPFAPGPDGAPAPDAQRLADAGAVSGDLRSVTLRVPLDDDVDATRELGREIGDAARGALAPGWDAAVGGELGRQASALDSRSSEAVGVAVAVVVLTVALGTALGMVVPIATALLAVGTGLAGLGLLGHAVDIPTVAPTLATMIGLGVGIDYALFLVARHRAVLATGREPVEAVAATAAGSGTAVFLAGGTVAVAVCGLAVTGIAFVSWIGVAAAIVVSVVLAASLTLTPALLGLFGRRLRPAPPRRPRTGPSGWERFAGVVTRFPRSAAVVGVAALLVLALPVATLELGQTDAGDRGGDSEQGRFYALTADGSGVGATGPLPVAVVPTGPDAAVAAPGSAEVERLRAALAAEPGVASVSPATPLPSGLGSEVTVLPTTAPSDPATGELIGSLRSGVLVDEPGLAGHVGGPVATRADLADRISERMPWLIAGVVGAASLLLMLGFRSLVIPVKAAAMNLLSVGAAYGAVVAVFQWGWGADLLGLPGPVPIDAYVPMMLFAVLFGLSMDYEVFLLSSIREHWLAGSRDGRGAVAAATRAGLADTGRIITAAALIMVAVFGSFVAVGDPTVKIFGVGLSVAVAVDATLVRCVLVPALMVLFGSSNFWLPAWLDERLPRVAVH